MAKFIRIANPPCIDLFMQACPTDEQRIKAFRKQKALPVCRDLRGFGKTWKALMAEVRTLFQDVVLSGLKANPEPLWSPVQVGKADLVVNTAVAVSPCIDGRMSEEVSL